MKTARILLGDDHPLFAEGSRLYLAELYEIVGVAVDGRTLVETALSLQPDLILLDISMPVLSGIEVARRVKASLPGVKLLFFTMHPEPKYVQAAFEAGGTGYLLKSAGREDLLAAVQKVLNGHIYISNELSQLWKDLRDPDHIVKTPGLSAREREVLQLIAEGWSGKEIATILNVSPRTIAFHRENLKRKLGVTTIAGLVRSALAGEPS